MKGGSGTPVTLESYLAWKEKKVAAEESKGGGGIKRETQEENIHWEGTG